MKTRLVGMALAAAALLLARGISADDKPASMGTCPVTGKPASKDYVADFDGAKVYFCCEKCPKVFAANPKKFAAKAHLQMVQTGQYKQTACPFMGRPMNQSLSINVEGVTVYLCCQSCLRKAKSMSEDNLIQAVFGYSSKGFKKAN